MGQSRAAGLARGEIMTPNTITHANALDWLPTLPEKSVHCVITSPPYYGRRNYGTDPILMGGDPNCEHDFAVAHPMGYRKSDTKPGKLQSEGNTSRDTYASQICAKCGAFYGELGLEPTPELYVQHLTLLFREVFRVLRDDGVLFLNIGDSWASAKGRYSSRGQGISAQSLTGANRGEPVNGSKPDLRKAGYRDKQLLGIPWRLAFALSDDGWLLRDEIIWNKVSCLPESVRDRTTRAHEQVFVLTKQGRYFWDYEAAQEPATEVSIKRAKRAVSDENKWIDGASGQHPHTISQSRDNDPERDVPLTRNPRSVWNIATAGYRGGHFAVFPQKLVRKCMIMGSPLDGIVLDPFMGVATVAVVALKLGRQYIGCERKAEYIQLAQERIQKTRLEMQGVKPAKVKVEASNSEEIQLSLFGENNL